MDSRKMERRFLLAGIGGAVAGSLLSGKALAGSLTPPPGPITATGKSLTEISDRIARTPVGVAEPCIPIESLPSSPTGLFVVSEPGSYIVTRNIQGQPNMNGIEVTVDNVDIDVCGFQLIGPPGSLAGIKTDRSNVTVYDGSLLGWDAGVDFIKASRSLLWDLVSIGAKTAGFMLGDRGQAYDLDVHATQIGIYLDKQFTLVEECGAWSCTTGFQCPGTRNFFYSNCTAECPLAFKIGPSNSHGPIVDLAGVGDISVVAGSSHPGANCIY
jgi:hypothetical protein